MKRFCRMLTVVFLYAVPALAQTGAVESPASVSESCEQGRPSRYSFDPADACWPAFKAALDAGNYHAALRFARLGCEKYRRGDYCSVVASVLDRRAPAIVRATTQSTPLTVLRRAAHLVVPGDLEDADLGLYFRRVLDVRPIAAARASR